jgi:hypothetical protein
MNSVKALAAALVAIIAVASFTPSAGAATLTFTNTSIETLWFSIMQIQADVTKDPISYIRKHPNPGTVGQVTIDIPGVAGDCYSVTAIDRDGPSAWSNRACLSGDPPSGPTGALVK